MKIGIFGTGAYGMALSSILINNNCEITMWTKFEEEKTLLETTRKNEEIMPGFKLSKEIKLTTNIEECARNKELLIIVIPVAFIESLCQEMKPYIKDDKIIIASKGIEQKTNLFINEIIEKNLDTKNISVLSGPTFAIDIPKLKPIGLTIATKNKQLNETITKAFSNSYTKLQFTDDIIGTELSGSIKNVFSIASGILEGLNCSESTQAMFLTDCAITLESLLEKLAAKKETALTYAGIGDLWLTCTSKKSRNYSLGYLIGTNASSNEIEKYTKETTVEGYYTLKSIKELLTEKNITIPLIDLLHEIIFMKKNPQELLQFISGK